MSLGAGGSIPSGVEGARRSRKLTLHWFNTRLAVAWRCLLFVVLLQVAGASRALADNKTPFYEDDEAREVESSGTRFAGSVTSSSFFYSESASPNDAEIPIETASASDRGFSEIRLRLRADNLHGSRVNFHLDFQGRKQIERCAVRPADGENSDRCEAVQSGLLGGDELYLREASARFVGKTIDVAVGRLLAVEIAATKFDGVLMERHSGEHWRVQAFAGLYPMRGSRSLKDDYAKVPSNPEDPMSSSKRLLPITGGAGASYQAESFHGSLGMAAIMPRGKTIATGKTEKSRVFVSSNGFWKQSNQMDFYHNVVLDLAGVRGPAVTNVSLGAVYHPSAGTRFFVRVDRVDTETLAVHAQQRLDILDAEASAPVQNSWYVARIAQESGELGATTSFGHRRFSVTAAGTVRRRPRVALLQTDRSVLSLRKAQALDVRVSVVDRKSFMGFRLGGSLSGSVGIGKEDLDRSKNTLATVELNRDLANGKGEFELNLSYSKSVNVNSSQDCTPAQTDFLHCFGTSDTGTLAAGAVVFFRPYRSWFFMAMANVATQSLLAAQGVQVRKAQPSVLMLTGFLRVAYRF